MGSRSIPTLIQSGEGHWRHRAVHFSLGAEGEGTTGSIKGGGLRKDRLCAEKVAQVGQCAALVASLGSGPKVQVSQLQRLFAQS